jgi:hypothetical protein
MMQTLFVDRSKSRLFKPQPSRNGSAKPVPRKLHTRQEQKDKAAQQQ